MNKFTHTNAPILQCNYIFLRIMCALRNPVSLSNNQNDRHLIIVR